MKLDIVRWRSNSFYCKSYMFLRFFSKIINAKISNINIKSKNMIRFYLLSFIVCGCAYIVLIKWLEWLYKCWYIIVIIIVRNSNVQEIFYKIKKVLSSSKGLATLDDFNFFFANKLCLLMHSIWETFYKGSLISKSNSPGFISHRKYTRRRGWLGNKRK